MWGGRWARGTELSGCDAVNAVRAVEGVEGVEGVGEWCKLKNGHPQHVAHCGGGCRGTGCAEECGCHISAETKACMRDKPSSLLRCDLIDEDARGRGRSVGGVCRASRAKRFPWL